MPTLTVEKALTYRLELTEDEARILYELVASVDNDASDNGAWHKAIAGIYEAFSVLACEPEMPMAIKGAVVVRDDFDVEDLF
jgi:hypothetical protein